MTLQFIIVMIATAINDRLQRKLDYVEEERRILRESSMPSRAARGFMAHYHRERFHQGLGGQLIEVKAGATRTKRAHGKVVCRSRLGGMLNHYHCETA